MLFHLAESWRRLKLGIYPARSAAIESIAVQPEPTTLRMFFALWPNAAVATELAKAGKALHEVCGGRLTRAETIHLTLAFLGEVELEKVDYLIKLAGYVRAHAFSLNLTRLGWWPRNHIVWAAPDEAPAELALLVDDLRLNLGCAAVDFDAKPFVPHITLLRNGNCKDNPLPSVGVKWRAEDFVLVKSVSSGSGAAYEVVGRWPLLQGNEFPAMGVVKLDK